jgi:hypothetical protein
MPDTDTDQDAAGKAIHISVTPQSPHVVSWRIWSKTPGATTWSVVNDGGSGDGKPADIDAGSLPSGTGIAVWVGIAGHPGTTYRVTVAVLADNAPVPGAPLEFTGQTSAAGGAVGEKTLTLP